MAKILSIIVKDTLVRFSSVTELIFYLVLPIVFTFMLGGVGIGQAEDTTLLLTDLDQSSLSRQFVDELAQADSLLVIEIDEAQAETQYNNQEAPAWLILPAGFETSALQGQPVLLDLKKRSNDTAADGAERSVRAAISAINRPLTVAQFAAAEAERIRPFATSADRQAFYAASYTEATSVFAAAPARLEVTRPALKGNQTYDQGTQASTGQLVVWVFIPLVGISGLLVYERNSKTLQRLVTTPTGKATFLLGTILGQLAAAVVQMILLIGFGVYVMGIHWGNSLAGLALMMLAFGLASAALGVTLGTFIKTEKQANLLSIMFGMVFSMLGGAMWPMELFPTALRTFAQLFPTYWAMVGFNNLAMRGLGLESVLLPAAVLLGFAVVFFGVGVARFRYE